MNNKIIYTIITLKKLLALNSPAATILQTYAYHLRYTVAVKVVG